MKKMVLASVLILTVLLNTVVFVTPVGAIPLGTLSTVVAIDNGNAKATAFYGNYLYVSTDTGLKVYDIENPSAPQDITPKDSGDLEEFGLGNITEDAVRDAEPDRKSTRLNSSH